MQAFMLALRMPESAGGIFTVALSNTLPVAINNGDYDDGTSQPASDAQIALSQAIEVLTANYDSYGNLVLPGNGFSYASSTNLHFHGIHGSPGADRAGVATWACLAVNRSAIRHVTARSRYYTSMCHCTCLD
jgi:hypothetical protein